MSPEPVQTPGLLRRCDAVSAGVDPDVLRAALRRGELRPLQRGIYLSSSGPASSLDRARAAVLAAAQIGSAASHRTAARVHGLVVPAGGPEHVTVPRAERRPHRDRLRVHTARMAPVDQILVDGVPLTGVARTLVDLCRDLDRVDAVWAVERALAHGSVTIVELEAAAGRLARAPGIIRARARFRAARPLSGSPLETQARLVIVDAGLPEPELQARVSLDDGLHAFLDLAYRDSKIGIELDGRNHESVGAVFHDRWRQNAVHSQEWIIYRFTWRDAFHDHTRMVATISQARATRASSSHGHLSLEVGTTTPTRRWK